MKSLTVLLACAVLAGAPTFAAAETKTTTTVTVKPAPVVTVPLLPGVVITDDCTTKKTTKVTENKAGTKEKTTVKKTTTC